MSKIQNTDGGFSIIGSKPKSFNFGLINLPYNMIKSKCLGTVLWNVKNIYRSSKSDKLIFSNSLSDSRALINDSTMFSTWFRLLSIKSAYRQISIDKKNHHENIYELPYLGYF